MRLSQYLLLGIGGVRALHALGVEPGVVHLNEGHAAFATLELARTSTEDDPFESVRRRTVFTTHTPVPAGNDTYPADHVAARLAGIAAEMGIDVGELVRRGRTNPGRRARAVRRHAVRAALLAHRQRRQRPPRRGRARHVAGPVARPRGRGRPDRARHQRRAHPDLDRRRRCASCSTATSARAGSPARSTPPPGRPSDEIPDADLWAARSAQRRELIELVKARSVTERLQRGDTPEYVRAAVDALDPDVLTIGFARRVATYKRLDLLLRDVDRALSLLGDDDRPVQFILAGKAHPRDDDGKRLVQRLFEMKGHPQVGRRVVYLDDYDVALGAAMTRGCDIWVNVPRPPLEASGTSGIKSAVNGGLQLSVLDGWWPEAYDGSNGWAIGGEVDDDHGAQDWRHAQELYTLLLEHALPTFYDRDGGRPAGRVAGDGPLRRCARSARTSAPAGWCSTTCARSTRPRCRPESEPGTSPPRRAYAGRTPADEGARTCAHGWIAAAVAAGLLVLPAGALAGGWATVSLSSTPDDLGAGAPWDVEMTILQHGRTPLDGVEPSITLTNGATGKTEYVAAKPTGRPGVYEARAVFPEAGRWTYTVDDGFSRIHDYPAVTIGGAASAAATAGDGFPWIALLAALLAGLAAAALTVALRRRRDRPPLGGPA